ncbi:Uncharacterised protein [Salmonella enterica subsp. enterica]|nr:Uncharacterised protein [Salmonella enterica subsp. enterica]
MIDGERSEALLNAGNRAERYGAAVAARQANRLQRRQAGMLAVLCSSTTPVLVRLGINR